MKTRKKEKRPNKEKQHNNADRYHKSDSTTFVMGASLDMVNGSSDDHIVGMW
jgi:hypothetical protein